MGRKRIIGRDAILDAAEQVIHRHGGHQLSLQLVAEAANISKGAIAYNFRTKDELLMAVFARESARFQHEASRDVAARKIARKDEAAARDGDAAALPRDARPVDRVAGWIAATRRENEEMIVKAAGLFTNMLQSETRRHAVTVPHRFVVHPLAAELGAGGQRLGHDDGQREVPLALRGQIVERDVLAVPGVA
ncbi:MAG: TetR/AcrR family transcriptional regulator [Pseudochelatococcus sp.]|uniref:TetR/AcrR family transcriptional regulator n=1 Tax=Pseudochelatococcus sp. TaxID=2020869 RepID=UPI003D8E9DCE